jgi:hypothetical protein
VNTLNTLKSKIDLNAIRAGIVTFFTSHFHKVSAETLGWLAVMSIHFATIPTLLAALAGLTDKFPPVDLVLFIWGGLVLMFFRSVLLKDMLNVVTIGIGFMIQASIMALMLFK